MKFKLSSLISGMFIGAFVASFILIIAEANIGLATLLVVTTIYSFYRIIKILKKEK